MAISTAVDPNAVARVVGIKTTFQNLKGGASFLPIRIGVFGQGATASQAGYSTDKAIVTSAKDVGDTYGYGSPLHLAVKQLLPPNGDGVGKIPVTVFPLKDDGSGVASVGTITPSGTQTTAASYKILVNEIESAPFVLSVGDVLADVLDVVIPAINAQIDMPVIASFGGVTAGTVTPGGTNTGDGTPSAAVPIEPVVLGGTYTLTCTDDSISGSEVFSVTDPNGVALPDLTVAVAYSSTHFTMTLAAGASDFVVGDTFTILMTSTHVDCTSKWKGVSANDIYLELSGTTAGVTFAFVQPTGGLVEPDVDAALAQLGNVWEVFSVNCLSISDTTTLDKYVTVIEPRWGALVKKPAMVFTGTNEASVTTAVVIPDARKTDRTNGQIVAPGSNNLPFVIAAKAVSRMSSIANVNPPVDYAGQQLTGLVPGTDAEQWDATERETAVSAGSSTVETVDNIIELSDTVLFYHPTGEDPPAYRFANDVIKVMNVLYNLALIFEDDNWKGKVLIPDSQATTNPDARKPSDAVAAVASMLDSLGLQAVVADPTTAKKTIEADISATNPRRLDLAFTYQISGNTGIISVDANWGFFFGSS